MSRHSVITERVKEGILEREAHLTDCKGKSMKVKRKGREQYFKMEERPMVLNASQRSNKKMKNAYEF